MSAADEIELLATYLALAEASPKSWAKIDFRQFDGAEPVFSGVYGDSDWAIPASLSPTESNVRPNVTLFSNAEDGADFVLANYRALHPKDYRGKARFMPIVVRVDHAFMNRDAGYEYRPGFERYAGWTGKRWVTANTNAHHLDPYGNERSLLGAQISIGMQWMRERRWRVLLGFEGKPRISFTTTPHGASGVFRLRDIPNGKARRVALRHWVSEHWRKTSTDKTLVKKHLRGRSEFSWNGLWCAIIVPTEEREREWAEKLAGARFAS